MSEVLIFGSSNELPEVGESGTIAYVVHSDRYHICKDGSWSPALTYTEIINILHFKK